MLNYINIPTRISAKQHFEFVYYGVNWSWRLFCLFLRWDMFWLFPLEWNVDNLNLQKSSLKVLSMLIFKVNNLWNNRLELCIEMFLLKFGFWLKRICCLFDEFFTHSLDGKNRSVIASVVTLPLHAFYTMIFRNSTKEDMLETWQKDRFWRQNRNPMKTFETSFRDSFGVLEHFSLSLESIFL